MSEKQRQLGDKLELNLQIYDGDDRIPLRVFVELLRADNTVITPLFEISYVSDGYYKESTEVMPNEQFVLARYTVFLNDGVTRSPQDSIEVESFRLVTAGGAVTTAIIEVSTIDGTILEEQTVDALIISDTIDGDISPDTIIEGVVEDGD